MRDRMSKVGIEGPPIMSYANGGLVCVFDLIDAARYTRYPETRFFTMADLKGNLNIKNQISALFGQPLVQIPIIFGVISDKVHLLQKIGPDWMKRRKW